VRLLAEHAGELVGMIGALPIPHTFYRDVGAYEVTWFVRPDRRGALAGVPLLDALEEWARQFEIDYLTMVAPEGSRVGSHLARRGYAPVESVAKPSRSNERRKAQQNM
jgi:GNAT superfamily N-acetyltransferase